VSGPRSDEEPRSSEDASLVDATRAAIGKPLVIVGVSGASGLVYAADLLASLTRQPVEVHLVVSNGAKRVAPTELEGGIAALSALADVVHKDSDIGASIASGSRLVAGMVVVPCSAGTLAKIANGHADSLLTRAAHVTLKERRKLLLVLREAPYSRPMLVNMLAANDAGATIIPASPGFYHQPRSIDDLVGGITARLLDHLGLPNERVQRWQGGA